MNKEKIGLIGLGLVGTAVSVRLNESGFEVLGYDVRTDLPEGVTVCSGPAEVFSLSVDGRPGRLINSAFGDGAVASSSSGARG